MGENKFHVSFVHDILLCPSCTLWMPVGASDGGRQTQPAVVLTQPQPVPILMTHLGDIPGLVCCPHCHHVVTSKVRYVPGRVAWWMCLLITLMGWDTDVHVHEHLKSECYTSFNKASSLYFVPACVCVFQVYLWLLSDSVCDTKSTRCTSFLPTVWKASAHIQNMTGLIRLTLFPIPLIFLSQHRYITVFHKHRGKHASI